MLLATAASPQLSIASLLSFAGAIGPSLASGRAVPCDLAVDGAAVSAKHMTYLGHAITGDTKFGDGVSFAHGELAVRHGWSSFLAGLEVLPVCQLIDFIQRAKSVALSMAIRAT